jgi:hypothetical protein
MGVSVVVSSVLPCLLLSGAVGFCVYLFIALKQEIWLVEKGWKRRAEGLREEADRLREQLELLGRGLREANVVILSLGAQQEGSNSGPGPCLAEEITDRTDCGGLRSTPPQSFDSSARWLPPMLA